MIFSLRTLFFSFKGRINRATYWTRAFPVLLACGVFVNAVHVIESQMLGMQGIISVTLSLLGLWPSLAVTVKRLHDRGRSGWFLLILLIPVLGPIWLLIEIWFLPGDQDANRFGDSPQDKGLPLQWIIPFEVVGVAAVVSLLVWTFLLSGATVFRALKANSYELIRMEVPVAGKVPLAKGNSLILMQVDGTASVGDVEISRCARNDVSDLPNEQVCQLKGSAYLLIGHPAGTPAFSVDTNGGRTIIILSVDFLGPNDQSKDLAWLIDELNRPVHRW